MTSNTPLPDKKPVDALTPQELVEKHIKDASHKITDDEMKRLKVGAEAESEEELQKEIENKIEEIDFLPGNDSMPDAYEILDA